MKINLLLVYVLLISVLTAVENSLYFDGDNDYVDFGDVELFDFSTDSDFSIGAWIKTGETDCCNGIVTKAESGANFTGYCFWISGDGDVGRLGFHYNDGSYTALNVWSNTYVNDGQWHYVFVTVRRGESGLVSLYIDGELDNSESRDMSFDISNTASLVIGMDRGYGWYDGFIDEITIWDYELTETEIADYMCYDFTGTETGLIGCWDFNTGTGTFVYDRTINNNDGSIIGALWNDNVPCQTSTNYSLYFDGDDDYVHIADPVISYGNEFTVEGWIKIPDTPGGDRSWIAHWDSPSTYYGFFFRIRNTTTDNNKVQFCVGDTSGNSLINIANESCPTNEWVHLAGVYDGTASYIYINGQSTTHDTYSGTTNGTVGTPLHDMYFGFEHWVGGMYMETKIDEVKIWDYALSQDEIQQNMCSVTSGSESGLIGYWNLNEGVGTIVYDLSPSNNNGIRQTPSYDIDNPCDDYQLPVTLSSFTAIYSNDLPILNWITQSESNNQGWNIFRSESDDLNSSMQLNTDLVPGAGTTSMPTEYSYNDESGTIPGNTYWYWLQSVSSDGETVDYGPITLDIPEDNYDPGSPGIPDIYGLHQNFPNPFNPSTRISYMMPENCTGTLTIYDIKGQEVITLFKDQAIGENEKLYIDWDSRDNLGRLVGSGVYIYKLSTNVGNYSRKMVLTK